MRKPWGAAITVRFSAKHWDQLTVLSAEEAVAALLDPRWPDVVSSEYVQAKLAILRVLEGDGDRAIARERFLAAAEAGGIPVNDHGNDTSARVAAGLRARLFGRSGTGRQPLR